MEKILNVGFLLLVGAFFGTGFYFLFSRIFRFPGRRAESTLAGVIGPNRESFLQKKLSVWLTDLNDFLSRRLPMSPYTREWWEEKLMTAGIPKTPESYRAECLSKSLLLCLPAIPVFFFSKILALGILLAAVLLYPVQKRGLVRINEHKRERLEEELPHLVSHIVQSLEHTHDVIRILENYRPLAGRDMAHELEITLADMRTGHAEDALARWESRVGSGQLSDVVRGLSGMAERGEVNEVYWQTLLLKYEDYRRQKLKDKARSVPGKVRRLSMCLLVGFFLMYVVVIVEVLFRSLGGLFL